ncbi:BamA/TamA family outer membrane protein [bacterium]|nr:BamA/TamA family outer membrane protein [bacterium]
MQPKKVFYRLIVGLFIFQSTAFVAWTQDERDSLAQKKNKLFYFPIIFWTPQTRLMGGGSVGYTMYKSIRDSTPSPAVISVYAVYTQRSQSDVTLSYENHWSKDRWHFQTTGSYTEWFNLFYGIGNNTTDSTYEEYTPKTLAFRAKLSKTVRSHLQIGLVTEFDYSRVVESESNGYFANLKIPGEKSGLSSGLGVSADYDSRDSKIYPTRGKYQQYSLIPFHATLGSDYNFVRFVADVRQYFSPFENHVIAYQAYMSLIAYNPPYYKMSLFGSDGLMRGYFPARFRDRNMVAFQAEYRMPLFWRISAAGFGGYGDVAHKIKDFRVQDLKYSVGFGIRFTIDRRTKSCVRLDIAVGKNSAYPTIAIGEAF